MASPVIRQAKESSTSVGQKTFNPTLDSSYLAGSNLLILGSTTANLEENVTIHESWTLIDSIHQSGTGTPSLWVLHKKVATAGTLNDTVFTTVTNSTIRALTFEITGCDPDDPTPYDSSVPVFEVGSGLTEVTVGPLSTPTARDGLAFVGVSMSTNPTTNPSWNNGFSPNVSISNLFSATKAHNGASSLSVTGTWTGTTSPRAGLINFFSGEALTSSGSTGWTIGMVA